MSMFTTASPVCNVLLGVLNYSSNNYSLMMGSLLIAGIGLLTAMLSKPTQVGAPPRPGGGAPAHA